MSYYRQNPMLRSGDVPWLTPPAKGAKSITVPVVQRVSGVLPMTEIEQAALTMSGRTPPMPIQEVVGTETVRLQWRRGYVKPDGTPGVKA